MSYVYAPKADDNHAEIVKAYEELFCSVLDLHKVGGGAPDILVGCAGCSELVEIKTEQGHLEPAQVTFHKTWRGSKIRIIRNRSDVINHVANIREKQATGKWGTNGKA